MYHDFGVSFIIEFHYSPISAVFYDLRGVQDIFFIFKDTFK